MDIKKLNKILEKLNEDDSLQEKAKEAIKEWLSYIGHESIGFSDILDEIYFEDIEVELASDYGWKAYGDERHKNALVIDVKNRPYINTDKLEIEPTEDFYDTLNFEIENFAQEIYDEMEDFVILGRSGGYWGFKNLFYNIKLSKKGEQELINILITQAKSNTNEDYEGTLSEAESENRVDDFLFNLIQYFGQEWLNEILEKDNFKISEEMVSKMKNLSDKIDLQEKAMNTKEYWSF